MPYSHPQALDKATIYRDWKHILPGAMALTGTAGYVNSIVLGFFATPVSHMSGAVSRLGLDIAQQQAHQALTSFLIILGFWLGAMLAGVFVGATHLGPSRRYGLVMMLEGLLLFCATLLLLHHLLAGTVLAAIACGLQNAMSSSYCGLMIRTTHVSGVVTDLGVIVGHWLRHGRIVAWKLKFLVALLFSFGAGGILGAAFSSLYGPICLLVAAGGCCVAGVLFFAIMGQQRENEEDEEAMPRTSIFPND